LIYRSIKKLQGAITVAYSVPGLRQQGWTFDDDPLFPDCTPDGVNGFRYLHQAYTATDRNYTGKVTVPTLWDKKTRRIVNNESPDIIRMLNSEFDAIAGDDMEARGVVVAPVVAALRLMLHAQERIDLRIAPAQWRELRHACAGIHPAQEFVVVCAQAAQGDNFSAWRAIVQLRAG
jgi:hypothetical protein